MLGVAATKAIALVIMTFITLFFAMLPLYVRKFLQGRLKGKAAQDALSACLCFGGGVLLATVFLHLIPEVRLLVQHALERNFLPHTNYPIAELIICAGFFLIYIIEHIVHTCSKHDHHSPSAGQNKKIDEMNNQSEEIVPLKQMSQKLNKGNDDLQENKHKNHNDVEGAGNPSTVAVSSKEEMPTLKAVIFVVAFSFHSIMEGLALGLVTSNRDVWFLFAALLAHKVVISFCMAMELLEVGVNKIGFFASMIIFSIASPLGGLMGTLIVSFANNDSQGGYVTTTVLQGISAGTILYVTFCEVLERERSKPESATMKMISIILGFGAMAILQIFDDEAYLQQNTPTQFINTTTEMSIVATTSL